MYIDRRLAGIQAVQTLSRLNRAHADKETYVLDLVNSAEEIQKAFRTYYTTAELANVTDPDIVYNLRAKLDAAGCYDDHEVDRVVAAELRPNATQGDLVAALSPVVGRLMQRYKAAQERLKAATDTGNADTAQKAKDELNALVLFKGDMAAFVRMYAFLSQMFDYGNTDIEKRAIFFRRLLPLLEFGRERQQIDLSKVTLTHHSIRSYGRYPLPLSNEDEKPKLRGFDETGTGIVREEEKVLLAEIIAKVNDLFEGDLTDDDRLVYVNNVLKGKLLQSETLVEQAANNTKEQFANSPDLSKALVDAIIDAFAAHETMSKQALDNPRVQAGLKDVLLGPAQLYEALRQRWSPPPEA
jgi:type I restriction enzyme R subunit